ncbi:MAG TPA: segregation/condensation protein A [Candidatus Krumholzibacteria bacterium]|nr:segregation/condensation protein A [Candidatus Krumholzibacteria bacterium]
MAEPRQVHYTTELEGLRAPLGVILYLIRRDNLDIYDIPIAKITREYLDYINMIEGMQIELAGEFFVLAATLMRIKVQMLLRKDDDTEEDPREELVRSLLEYRKMVEAARTFREMEEHRANIFTRPVPPEEKDAAGEPVIDLSLFQLMRAFQEVMTQFEGADVREVELEQFTIEEKIAAVEAALKAREPVLFADLFQASRTRLEVIVMFMATLELLKHGHARVQQDASFGSIWIYQGPNFGRPMGEVSDWSAEPEAPLEVGAPAGDVPADLAEDALPGAPPEEQPPTGATMEQMHGESEPR